MRWAKFMFMMNNNTTPADIRMFAATAVLTDSGCFAHTVFKKKLDKECKFISGG